MSNPITPKSVLDDLKRILPRRLMCSRVKLTQDMDGSLAETWVGRSRYENSPVCGLGDDLPTAVAQLMAKAAHFKDT